MSAAEWIVWLADEWIEHFGDGFIPTLTSDAIVSISAANPRWLSGYASLRPILARDLALAISARAVARASARRMVEEAWL